MKKHAILGPLFIISANVCYSFSHILVKSLSTYFSTTQIMFFRFVMGPLILLPLVYIGFKKVNLKNPKMLFLRAFFGVTAMFCFFLALKNGDPGKSSLLFQLSILWTFIISVFIYKDKAHLFSKIAFPFCFIGLFLILSPISFTTFGWSEFYAILASFLNTGVILSLKELRKNHDSFTVVLYTYSFACLSVTIPSFLTTIPPLSSLYLVIICMGLVGFIGQMLMTEGFHYSPAWLCSSLALIGTPMMYLFGILFFNEVITLTSLVGISIMLVSLSIITIKQ
jgi:drug/metabolite transporter (DMT)-like permease